MLDFTLLIHSVSVINTVRGSVMFCLYFCLLPMIWRKLSKFVLRRGKTTDSFTKFWKQLDSKMVELWRIFFFLEVWINKMPKFAPEHLTFMQTKIQGSWHELRSRDFRVWIHSSSPDGFQTMMGLAQIPRICLNFVRGTTPRSGFEFSRWNPSVLWNHITWVYRGCVRVECLMRVGITLKQKHFINLYAQIKIWQVAP